MQLHGSKPWMCPITKATMLTEAKDSSQSSDVKTHIKTGPERPVISEMLRHMNSKTWPRTVKGCKGLVAAMKRKRPMLYIMMDSCI